MNDSTLVPANYQTQVELGAYTTMAAAATAAHLVRLTDASQLPRALRFAEQRELAVFVLGDGSNTVFASDFSGLILQVDLRGIRIVEQAQDHVLLDVAAGENWHNLVEWCLAQGFYGLENLALIPGTVGAAPIQNIGAYGVEVEKFIAHVETIDLDGAQTTVYEHHECEFAYRHSVFKAALRDRVLITSVRFRLPKQAKLVTTYPALREMLPTDADAHDVFDAVCRVRQQKLPMPSQIPNSGSFFKNPIISVRQFEELKHDHPGVVGFAHGEQIKLAAAWLIEQDGWKSRDVDGVSVHQDQALVVINPNKQTGSCVLRLAYSIQASIKARFGVELEIEPRIVC